AMRLIAEEGWDPESASAIPFERFRRAFPLWHPGWWEPEVGFVPRRHDIDLWMFLGNGDPAAAATRWQDLVVLAKDFCAGIADGTLRGRRDGEWPTYVRHPA